MRDYQKVVRDLSKNALKSGDKASRLFWSMVISSAQLKAKSSKEESTSKHFLEALIYVRKNLLQTLLSLPPNTRTEESGSPLAMETLTQLRLVNSVLPETMPGGDITAFLLNLPYNLQNRKDMLRTLTVHCELNDLILDKAIAMEVIQDCLTKDN